ncbi:hypothetical protein D9613_009242 [Agrocybe pediades]|uniref:Uncharacterized protein n=1 Tax=Agrocybe pediades TaxID=84607 RepID=A0A8H4R388_9AGAR|nr:hypothetical protein D9613_009242 [Agrocybe pediades]KAF9560425.1 hypothetical protein CPC08DRAFT_665469 [Agrocybe pediades]
MSQAAFPYTVARSTTVEESGPLLAALLAAANIDELSNGEVEGDPWFSVKNYIKHSGRLDKDTNRTGTGIMFWLYPTGLHGPYHEDQEGQIQQHGTLITIERGTSYDHALQKCIEAFRTEGLAHVHVAKDN